METEETKKDHEASIMHMQLERISQDVAKYTTVKEIGREADEIKKAIAYDMIAFERSVSSAMNYVNDELKGYIGEKNLCVKIRIVHDCIAILEDARQMMMCGVHRLANSIEADDPFLAEIREKLRDIEEDYFRASLKNCTTIIEHLRD